MTVVTVNGFHGTVRHMTRTAVPDGDLLDATAASGDLLGENVSRRDRRTARTRQAIVDAARALIEEQGWAETTVDQIAERADVAPRTFFRHFTSKEAVIFADYEDHRRRMLEMMRARPATEHPLRSVVAGLADFCALVDEDRDRFAFPFRIVQQHDVTYDHTMLKAQTCESIGTFIAERLGAAPGDPRPHTWAVLMMTMFGSAMRCSLEVGGTGDPRQRFLDLVAESAAGLSAAATEDPPA
jgi:AcrR family transcriptional regulator